MYKSLYGLDITPEDDLAKKATGIVGTFARALISGGFPTYEWFPWLVYLPSWFPGCEFKRVAIECGRVVEEVDTIPFDIAVENLVCILPFALHSIHVRLLFTEKWR